jgi:phosphoribosylamine--glycine ligase
MLTPDGPKVLEFNVRFGDPEAQVVLPRLDGDLAGLLAEVADGSLRTEPRFLPDAAVCVVLASDGYPEAPRTGDAIVGLHDAGSVEGVTVFHAGTALPDGGGSGGSGAGGEGVDTWSETVVTSGGRVLGVTALAGTIEDARRRAYRAVSAISWPGMQSRSDIAEAAAGAGAAGAVEPRPSGPVASAGVVS